MSQGGLLHVVEILFVLAAGFFCGLIAAQLDKLSGTEIAWETLVTGLLAVAAAFVTVRQMVSNDEAQDRRHRELVRITQLPAITRMTRAAAVASVTAGNLQRMGDVTIESLKKLNVDPDLSGFFGVTPVFNSIRSVAFDDPDIVAAEAEFPLVVKQAFQMARSWNAMIGHFDRAFLPGNGGRTPDEVARLIAVLQSSYQDFETKLREYAADLARAA